MSEFKATMLFENLVGEYPDDLKPVLMSLCVASETAHGALRKAADFIEARAGIVVKGVSVSETTAADRRDAVDKPVMVVTDLTRGLPPLHHGLLPQHLCMPMFGGIGSFYREHISDDAPTMEGFDFKDTLKALDRFRDSWTTNGGLVEWLLSPKVTAKALSGNDPFADPPAALPVVFAEGSLPKAMGLGHFRITRSQGGAGWTDVEKSKKN